MRAAIIVAPLLFCLQLYSQIKHTPSFLFTGKADSVHLLVYVDNNKEVAAMNEQPYEKLVKTIRLNEDEVLSLNKRLLKKSSFVHQWALLVHSDIRILYFKDGRSIQRINISSITRNIEIERKDCPQPELNLNRHLQPCAFYHHQASKRLQRHINRLLSKHAIYIKFHENVFWPF